MSTLNQACAAAALALLTAAAGEAQADAHAQFKAQCASCHGADGGGNASLQAPPLAGGDAAYLARQLAGFRAGHRGGEGASTAAVGMRAVAQALGSDAEITALARHAAGLKPASLKRGPAAPASVVNQGKSLFGVCMACHGGSGEGNAALSAPPLRHLPAWYLAAQLEAYRDGRRGTQEGDRLGRQMRQVASEALASPDDAQAVAAFVATLGVGR